MSALRYKKSGLSSGELDLVQRLRFVPGIERAETVQLVIAYKIAAIVHAQRAEEMLLQIIRERLAADDLDQTGDQFQAVAVTPAGKGLEQQGNLGNALDGDFQIAAALVDFLVNLTHQILDRMRAREADPQPGGVRQRLTDGDGPFTRLQDHRVAFAGDINRRVFEFR